MKVLILGERCGHTMFENSGHGYFEDVRRDNNRQNKTNSGDNSKGQRREQQNKVAGNRRENQTKIRTDNTNQENENPNINRNLPFQGQFKNYNIYNQPAKPTIERNTEDESTSTNNTNNARSNVPDDRDSDVRDTRSLPVRPLQSHISEEGEIIRDRNNEEEDNSNNVVIHRRPVFERLVQNE